MKKFLLQIVFPTLLVFIIFCLFIAYAGAQTSPLRELAISKESESLYRADWISDGWDQSKNSTVFLFAIEKYFDKDSVPIVQYVSTPLPWVRFYCKTTCRVTCDFTRYTKLIQPRPGADLDYKVLAKELSMRYQVEDDKNYYFNLNTQSQLPLPIEIRTPADLPKWFSGFDK